MSTESSPLRTLLDAYRAISQTEREKGTYFEDLIACYIRHEASYRDLYRRVWRYADWAKREGRDARDTGIDLVAQTHLGEYHAIQCKFYDESYQIRKNDIDSFFTASGQEPFKHRVIVSTTDQWSVHAEKALIDQRPPVSRIDLQDLEASQIDWSQYQPGKKLTLRKRKTLRPHQRKALGNVVEGLVGADRGKLIMACGTGKTLAWISHQRVEGTGNFC